MKKKEKKIGGESGEKKWRKSGKEWGERKEGTGM